MKSFIELAQQADKELAALTAQVEDRDAKLSEKATILANTEASLEEKRVQLDTYERQLMARNEEVTRKEINVRRDEEVRADVQQAAALRDSAAKDLKKAEDTLMEVKQVREEVAKREMALAEREKNYKEEIRKQIGEKMLGITI